MSKNVTKRARMSKRYNNSRRYPSRVVGIRTDFHQKTKNKPAERGEIDDGKDVEGVNGCLEGTGKVFVWRLDETEFFFLGSWFLGLFFF